jgi:hypothetical protein
MTWWNLENGFQLPPDFRLPPDMTWWNLENGFLARLPPDIRLPHDYARTFPPVTPAPGLGLPHDLNGTYSVLRRIAEALL